MTSFLGHVLSVGCEVGCLLQDTPTPPALCADGEAAHWGVEAWLGFVQCEPNPGAGGGAAAQC